MGQLEDLHSIDKETIYGGNEVKGSTSEVTEVISKGLVDQMVMVGVGGN